MLKYPLCVYSTSFPAGGIRRVFVGVMTIIVIMIKMAIFVHFAKDIPGAIWAFPLPIILTLWLGRKLMGTKLPQGLKILRFDWGSKNFFYQDSEVSIEFRSDEAKLEKVENNEVIFAVKGKRLQFPQNIYAAENMLTAIYMHHRGRTMGMRISFESGGIQVLPM